MTGTAARLWSWLGAGLDTTRPLEKFVAALGGAVAILAVWWMADRFAHPASAPLLVASIGASAVLLFAVPHGPLSQPWPLVGGHLVSALAGVTAARLVAEPTLAAALAVGVAIGAMYVLRCIHPPGGATALYAVIGGPGVHGLGYGYVIDPVLANVGVILLIAVAFNYPFRWRRYPARWARSVDAETQVVQAPLDIDAGDLRWALERAGSFVDIDVNDLVDIYRDARAHARQSQVDPVHVLPGRYFSNGDYGEQWAVRQVMGDAGDAPPVGEDLVIYRVVAGLGRRRTGTCSRAEFAAWARHRVYLDENTWRRMAPDTADTAATERAGSISRP
ncbi:MAG: HPP family protein [Chromatiales bacterium]|nr:HPP family protein [Chromatiales bacterium]